MTQISRIMRPVRRRSRQQRQDRLGLALIVFSLTVLAVWLAGAVYLDLTRPAFACWQ